MNHRMAIPLVVLLFDSVLAAEEMQHVGQEGRIALLERAIQAASGHEVFRAHQELFVEAPANRVTELQSHSHHGVALRASWELVRRAIDPDWRPGEEEELPRPPTATVHRFLGFVEGRLGVGVPLTFEGTMLNGEGPADWLRFRPARDWRLQRTVIGLDVNEGAWVSRRNGDQSLILAEGEDSCRLPRELAEPLMLGAVGVVFAMEEERCVFGLLPAAGGYRIKCVDRPSSDVRWSAEVWATRYAGGSGISHHAAEMIIHDGTLYVFGAQSGAMYIEGFRMCDGENIFRFSTTY